MKFLVPNYSCLQNPWLRGYRPQIPVLSVLNWICWTHPPEKKILGTPLRYVTFCDTRRGLSGDLCIMLKCSEFSYTVLVRTDIQRWAKYCLPAVYSSAASDPISTTRNKRCNSANCICIHTKYYSDMHFIIYNPACFAYQNTEWATKK